MELDIQGQWLSEQAPVFLHSWVCEYQQQLELSSDAAKSEEPRILFPLNTPPSSYPKEH